MPFTGVNLRAGAITAGVASDNTKIRGRAYVNAEASQEMPFGTMLVQGTGDDEAKVFAAPANKMIGVLRNQFAYAVPTELGTIGLKPKTTLGVAQNGPIMVVVSEAVTPASAVRVRGDTNAGALGAVNGPGTFCTTASAGHTVRLPFARFLGTTTGSGVVEITYDMAMRDTAVAD